MKIINKNKKLNNALMWTSIAFSALMITIFLILVGFILGYAIEGFRNFGIKNILFDSKFDSSEDKYSFWMPFSITLLTSVFALAIAIPMGIKVALFTKYRLSKKYRKSILIVFQVLSGIPSVIFGLFAEKSLGIIWLKLFQINPSSIFNGSIMLSFMVIPTIVTMTIDSLNNVDETLINNPLALGNTKTRAIYKIVKKAARPGIVVAIILAISRAIGESMAISMILQAQPTSSIYQGGFSEFLNSSNQTLGAFISTAMFADKDPEKMRPLLYSFGLIMLIISMILNMIIFSFSNSKNKKINSKFIRFEQKLYEFISWPLRQFKVLWEKITFKHNCLYREHEQISRFTLTSRTQWAINSPMYVWSIDSTRTGIPHIDILLWYQCPACYCHICGGMYAIWVSYTEVSAPHNAHPQRWHSHPHRRIIGIQSTRQHPLVDCRNRSTLCYRYW